jgi:hypothetical protein
VREDTQTASLTDSRSGDTFATVRRLAVLVLAVLVAGCGGGDDESSPASLKTRLLPASEVPGFKVERSFEWDNAIDLTDQGLFVSENTRLSDVVDVIEEAGFEAGAGEALSKGRMGPGMTVLAAEFASDDGAEDVRDRLHQENLKQPCYGACSQIQSGLPVTGIPDAKGAQTVPNPKPPPNAPPPFEGYAVEFTIGPYLYVVNGGGPPGSGMKNRVVDAATALYEQVKDSD